MDERVISGESNNSARIAELSIHGVLPYDIISVNKPVYASGCLYGCSGQGSNFDYRNINDGFVSDSTTNDEHTWIPDTSTDAWVYMDLGTTYDINEMDIFDEEGNRVFLDREPQFSILYGVDNVTWTNLTNNVNLQNGAKDKFVLSSPSDFSIFSARYIKLANVAGESNEARIAELSVYGN